MQQTDAVLTTPFDPNFSFGSEAANLEYSILSAILGNPSPTTDSSSTPPPSLAQQNYSPWPSDPFATSPRLSYSSPYVENQLSMADPTSPRSAAHYLTYPYPHVQQCSEPPAEIPFPPSHSSQSSEIHPLQPRYPLDARPRSPATVFLHDPKDMTSRGFLSPSVSNSSVTSGALDIVRPKSCGSKLRNINDRITAPFDYTEGYHFLMKHLPTRCVCY